MSIAIISDLHFGDATTRLVKNGSVSDDFNKFRDKLKAATGGGPVDFLVLDGDVLDFSISPFEDSCKAAMPFFQALKDENIANNIVYIPGNHDKQVWDAVEWETNIVQKLRNFKDPRGFRRTQPGIIDLTVDNPKIKLPGVSGEPGDIFLKGLFRQNEELPISVVYPNLYVTTADNKSILITHGHMMETAWTILSDLFSAHINTTIGLKELEEWNIPLTSMICTGIGQAGDVSEVLYQIQQEAYQNKTNKLKKVLSDIEPKVDDMIKLPWYLEFLDDAGFSAVKKLAIKMARNTENSRYDQDFFRKDHIYKKFETYYSASVTQMEQLGLKPAGHFIFGHTHDPVPYDKPMETKKLSRLNNKKAMVYNTGGWLSSNDPDKYAEVYYITNDQITSFSV